ncbi:hypothetical protein P9D34_00925 [Bacillus swezeyi]|uniref:Permease n=1 Tax=Bacillus swezeyi TaxID=1925020 RepID=A0A1R1QR48_9BACI|nr:hypothetical protein [Bacillus swezeyi]MEC1259021.1 hypothetical protein [Bacillus swezeyi]MED2928018.1 hypothetical protein [Bacillus swezeyi]MED2942278.1 hypothetical protein [Bacillus swezeyi]MED2965070.1 hypothetical protein [Bacillus swezeyi]MED2977824.1 hypothetical protein [Bacillus swezeyi]
MTYRKSCYIIGGLFVFIFVVQMVVGITTASLSLIELLMLGAMAFLSFAAGYLYPQFKQKDERSQLIRQKGMEFSMIALSVYFLVLILGMQLGFITLAAVDVVRVLVSLQIITIFSSWIILSKKF